MYAQLHGLLCISYSAGHSCDPSSFQIGCILMWPSLDCREDGGIVSEPYFSIAPSVKMCTVRPCIVMLKDYMAVP
jgi:hypothetical protein